MAIKFTLILQVICLLDSLKPLSASSEAIKKRWPNLDTRKLPEEALEKLLQIKEMSPSSINKDLNVDICYTPECLDASLALLYSVNFSIDPCNNFYDFACGRWMEENPVPSEAPSWNAFNILNEEVHESIQEILIGPLEPEDNKPLKQAKKYYAQCVDTDALEKQGLAPLVGLQKENGGWPAITTNWNPSGFDLFAVIAQARRDYGQKILMYPFVRQDMKNTSTNLVCLDQPDFFLPRSVLLNPSQNQPRLNAYKSYFISVAKELANLTGVKLSEDGVRKEAEDVLAFETRIAGLASEEESRSVVERVYNPYKLNAYQMKINSIQTHNLHAKIPWKSVLDKVFSTSGVTIKDEEDLLVLEKDYLGNLRVVLDETDIRTIANYVHWRIISGLLSETIQIMRSLQFQFEKVNSGLEEPKPRESACMTTALTAFGTAIAAKYVEEEFEESAKTDVNRMMESIRSVFKDILAESGWMDQETKSIALVKVGEMRKFVGYPNWLFNQSRLEQEYAGVEIIPGNKHFQTVLALSRWVSNKELQKLRVDGRKDEDWLISPTDVNANYLPDSNSLNFPAGILQPPFYHHKGPKCLNYGGIGTVIAHELTHGYDLVGSQFDASGNVKQWWSQETLGNFYDQAQCMVDQYSAYETEVGSVNGKFTASENVADNGGLSLAFTAYQNWVKDRNGGKVEARLPGLESFSPDHLFFLAYGNIWCQSITPEGLRSQLAGDSHSPARFRVLGPLSNHEGFSDVWECPPGTPMNPANKCALW